MYLIGNKAKEHGHQRQPHFCFWLACTKIAKAHRAFATLGYNCRHHEGCWEWICALHRQLSLSSRWHWCLWFEELAAWHWSPLWRVGCQKQSNLLPLSLCYVCQIVMDSKQRPLRTAMKFIPSFVGFGSLRVYRVLKNLSGSATRRPVFRWVSKHIRCLKRDWHCCLSSCCRSQVSTVSTCGTVRVVNIIDNSLGPWGKWRSSKQGECHFLPILPAFGVVCPGVSVRCVPILGVSGLILPRKSGVSRQISSRIYENLGVSQICTHLKSGIIAWDFYANF